MIRFVRGSTILFTASAFVNASGATIVPTAVTLTIEYPAGSTSTQEVTYEMDEDSGEWTAEWESYVAYPGTVYWSITAEGSDDVTKDGELQLSANIANPDP